MPEIQLRFYVEDKKTKPRLRIYPYVVLLRDNWDDYGFKTTFNVTLHVSSRQTIDLGDIKIIKRNQRPGPTPFKRPTFSQLTDDYCSLAQSLSYYEKLLSLGRDFVRAMTTALRDVATNAAIQADFAADEGFRISLLRSGAAERVLLDASTLLGASVSAGLGGMRLIFETSVGGQRFRTRLDFEDMGLPNRVIAVIGYNGAGKTQFVSNLAYVCHLSEADRNRQPIRHEFGSIISEPGSDSATFGSVVMISYSAFDTFKIPGGSREERQRVASTGEVFGYRYCGLRAFSEKKQTKLKRTADRLMSIDEIEAQFSTTLKEALRPDRRPIFIGAVGELLREGNVPQRVER